MMVIDLQVISSVYDGSDISRGGAYCSCGCKKNILY